MSVPTYTTVIERFFKEALEPILRNYVFNGYSALANHLRVPLGTAVVLFIVLLGLSISQGWVKLSMPNFIKAAIKIGLIYTFAMNWGIFSQWIVDGIQKSAGQIGDWLVSATPIPLPQFGGTGVDGAMQSVLIEFTKIGNWIWAMGSWHNWGPYLTALMIWGFGYAMILIGLFEIVLAKIMLAILFTTAPLFICFTLFKPTHSYFDRWLGLVVGYAFLLIFVSGVLALALSFAQWAIADTFLSHALNVRLIGFIPAMIVGFIGIGVILKVSHMAQSIGGSVSTASGSALLAGTVGGFVGGTLGAMSMMSKGLGAVGGAVGGFKKMGTSITSSVTSAGSSMMNGIRNQLRGGK